MGLPIWKGLRYLRDYGILPFVYRSLDYTGVHTSVWNTVTSRRPLGTNVFDLDWELLVILDACRPDLLSSVNDSRFPVEETARISSVGSMSAEWMLKTFTENRRDAIAETAFVSGNIWSHRIFNERFHEHENHDYDMIHRGYPRWEPVTSEAFAHYETVYPFGNHDLRLHPEAEHVPHVLTDRTIAVGRQTECERLIVHYTLPHLNHIARALDWNAGNTSRKKLMSGEIPVTRALRPEEKSFGPARRGETSAETVRENYIENIRLALEYVSILLENVDAERAIVSADHGEALGENGIWSHPFGCPFSTVRTVPWVATSASDERTYESTYGELERPPTEQELQDHLQAMGYYA